MGSYADNLEDKMLDHIFQNGAYTPTATVELALWVGDPLDTGAGGAEAAYTNYARQTISFAAAAARAIAQSAQVDFPQAGVSGQAGITHYAVFEAGAGGILAHGALSGTINVVQGNTPSIAAGEVIISGSAGAMSDYLVNTMMDFVFRNQAFAAPTIHLALLTAVAADGQTGATMTEVADAANYGRLAFADWSASSGGALQNNTPATFNTPSGSWGTVVATAIVDSATHGAGNVLFYDNAIIDQLIGNGDTVRFNTGDFDVSLS